MREILFRGRPDDGSDWVFGDLIHRRICKHDIVVIRTEDSGFDNYNEYEVIPETVGQYTGLTDKNGKKIFEGDILEYRSFSANGAEEVKHAVVFWDEHRWSRRVFYNNRWINCWKGNDICDIYRHIVAKFGEAIGNIHDNPELLGGADNG